MAEGLRNKRVLYTLWHTADFPTRSGEGIIFRDGQLAIKIEGPELVIDHQAALSCGFTMPDTLYSNDPDEIRRFIAGEGGRVIFKILIGAPRPVDRAAAIVSVCDLEIEPE